jgi:hypothetical protein
MFLPTPIAKAIRETIIGRLAPLFLGGAGGDLTVARHAADQMLAAYNAETPDELSLAAEIISLQLHTLEALSHASGPDLSLNKILRLRGSAVSLSRESHKAQRKLDQLQRMRRAGVAAPSNEAVVGLPQSTPASPKIENALDLIKTTRDDKNATEKSVGKNWSQSFHKRQAAQRITENLKDNQTRHANLATYRDTAVASAYANPTAPGP